MTSFLQRTVHKVDEEGTNVIIMLSPEQLSHGTPDVGVTLDIDVFRAVDVDLSADDIWPILSVLHAVKNRVFFACMKEAALERYK